MARSRGSFRGRAPSRRKKSWGAGPGQLAPQTAITASGAILASAALQALSDGLTVIRTRGMLELYVQTNVADAGYTGAFGIGIATLSAVVAGAASVPTPITEQDWDGWMFWQSFSLKTIDQTAGDLGLNAVADMLRIPIDSKAMRKVSADESMYAAIEVEEVGTSTLRWHLDSRILIALP